MANTPNYNLYKPSRNDSNVEVDTSLTNNFTIIDTELKTNKDGLDTHKNDANAHTSDKITHADGSVKTMLDNHEAQLSDLQTETTSLDGRVTDIETLGLEVLAPNLEGRIQTIESDVEGFLAPATFDSMDQQGYTFDEYRLGYVENRVGPLETSLAETMNYLNDLGVNIKKNGAVGDGVTDDAPAIRACIDFLKSKGGGKLFIPDPEVFYLIKSYDPVLELNGYYCFKLDDNITVEGNGKFTSVLKIADNIFPSTNDTTGGVNVFLSHDKKNVHLKNFKVDFNGANNIKPNSSVLRTCYGAQFNGGENCSVVDCAWENNPGLNTILFGGWNYKKATRKGALIKNNYIHNGGSGVQGNVYQNDFSGIYSDWHDTLAENNVITNDSEPTNGRGGIEIHGNNSKAIDNYMENCYPALYICSDFATWVANKSYNVGDIVIPKRGKFVGRQYICTVAGISGAAEPTWTASTTDNTVTWADNGKAETVNQIVERNTFEKCHGGIMIWNGGGDFSSIKILNNKMGIKKSSAISANPTGILQVSGNDASNLTLPVLFNSVIEGNEIFEQDVLSTSGIKKVMGITLNAFDGLKLKDNHIHDVDDVPIYLMGNPRMTNTGLVVEDNTIADFHINNTASPKVAIMFNFSGSGTNPVKAAFDALNIKIRNNIIKNKVMDANAYGFGFYWDAGSAVTNLVVDNNELINLGGIKTGTQIGAVVVTPETNFQSTSGWVKDKSGFIIQWMKVTYSASAGTNQSFSFPTAFKTVNVHVIPTGADTDVIFSRVSNTATGVTIKGTVSGRDAYIYAIGQ